MILQFFAAFIGAAGFGFLFHLQFKHIFPAALGGVSDLAYLDRKSVV